MKKIIYKPFITLVMLFFLAPVQAQERILRIAHKMFKEQKYISAQEAYLKVIKRNYRSAEVLKNLGDCYYFNGQQEEAVNWYKEFIESYPDQIAPEYYFKFAQCLKSIEDYSGSDQYMDRLLAVKSYDIRAKIFDKERDYLKRIEYQSGRYEIENSPINSSFTDFGTAYYGDNVVFSSSRDTLLFNKRIHKWNDEAFLQLYKANHDPETGLLFNLKTFAQELSTKFHESTPAFSNDGNTIYFTRNHKTDSKKELVRLKIYRSFKNEDETWSIPEDLPFNDTSYSTSHPALSADGNTLYFSSDMPGGYGMSDLYKISINDDGSFGSPINLGDQINTEGKENFPFVTDEELYFSSNGHPGLGSLDIYRIKLTSTPNFMDVINVGAPINSPKDDFAYIMNPETKRGYFSSNRSGGKGGDDIYSIYESLSIKSFYLTTILGTVTDKDTQEPLEGVTVTIYDDQGNLIKEMTSKEDGKYYFFSEEELINSSIIKTTKQGYQPNEHSIQKDEYAALYQKDTELEKEYIPTPITKTNYVSTLEKQISNNDEFNSDDTYDFELILDPKHFDTNSTEIISNAKSQLDNIVNLLLKYPKVNANIKAYSDSSIDDPLSQIRANEVKQYLIDNGVPAYQLTATGVNRKDVKLEEKIRLTMIVPMPIHFQFNSDKIELQEHEGLDKVSELMNIYPKMKMEVHSHADSRSSFWYNKKLSVERMRSTIAYLTDKGKINWRRIRGKAYGERKLYNDCADGVPCTEDQHQKNRRSEFIINK